MHSSCITITIISSSIFLWIFFQSVASVNSYNTRLTSKSTYYINTVKTNNGKFNFHSAAVELHLDGSMKHVPLKTFENKVKSNFLQSLQIMSFQLVFVYLFIDLFIIYLFIYFFFSSLFID